MPSIRISVAPHGSKLYWKAVELRSKHLREPLGLVFTSEELKAEVNSTHIVATRGGEVVGSVTLHRYNKKSLQLRQMVVAPTFQRQHVGKKIVKAAEKLAISSGFHEIELHARESAVTFYQKCGYKIFGEPFVEVTIPHIAMKKYFGHA